GLADLRDREIDERARLLRRAHARRAASARCRRHTWRCPPSSPIAGGEDRWTWNAGVAAEDALINIVVGIRPELIRLIRPVHVVDEIVVGIGPEQRADETDDEAAMEVAEPRVRETSCEDRTPRRRTDRTAEHRIDQLCWRCSGAGSACKRRVHESPAPVGGTSEVGAARISARSCRPR